jgi:YggT family protein
LYEHIVCTIFAVARLVLTAEIIAIFARIIVSWIPDVPAALTTLLRRLTDGVLLPFQTVIPIIAGMDFSPLAALLVLQAIAHYVPICPTG